MADWRPHIFPKCPHCGNGGEHSDHHNCPQNGKLWIDIQTGYIKCDGCKYSWYLEDSISHCSCGAKFKGGEIWQGMAQEIRQIANLVWIRRLGINKGHVNTEFLGWWKNEPTANPNSTFNSTEKGIIILIFLIIFGVFLSSFNDAADTSSKPNKNCANLTINAYPTDSQIKIMNIVPKYKPGICLKPGRYDIKVTRNGYQGNRQSITVNSDMSLNITLKKRQCTGNRYSLTVNAHPSDSRIRIMNIKPKYKPGICLKSGRYDIKVTHKGYQTDEQSITVDSDTSINVTLTAK